MSISFIGGTSNTAASAATVVATYAPAAGDIVIIFVTVGGAVTGLCVQDSNGQYLTPGPVVASTSVYVAAGTGYMYSFWGIAGTGVTAYTANWTTSQVSSIVLGEYSGVGAILLTLATNNATGTSTTASITPTTTDTNAWLVCAFANNSTVSFSSIAGSNLRENSGNARTAVCCLVDSGAVAINTAQLVKATQGSSVAFGSFAFELRPVAGALYSASYTTGSLWIPVTLPGALISGGIPAMKALFPGTGWAASTGVVYGNSYKPGQTFP